MNSRTTFKIDPSQIKIDFDTPVVFIGSCFASEIGKKCAEGKLRVIINPAGAVYNPVSVSDTLLDIIENKTFNENNLYFYKGLNISFSHYSDFSSEDIRTTLNKINSSTQAAHDFLREAKFLFITFGTARVYKFNENGKIVSNCHKLPPSFFTSGLLETEDIVNLWSGTIDKLRSFNKNIHIIFTLSPVRHWKDSAHGNQISKAILLLSIEELVRHDASVNYFPAYELIMDDLRDYRYYAEDMLHPSSSAINYIWEAFTDCYLDPKTKDLWKEIQGITRAFNHKFLTDSSSGKSEFASNILKKISDVTKKNPAIDLETERAYFTSLLS
jgi:hypothetical protein